jgi:ascorbate-specific PTS system EIIC-type component UlaA
MVAGDFLGPSIFLGFMAIIGFFVRPHWKTMSHFTKTVVGFLPALGIVAFLALLVGVLIGYDSTPTIP